MYVYNEWSKQAFGNEDMNLKILVKAKTEKNLLFHKILCFMEYAHVAFGYEDGTNWDMPSQFDH